jgi:hypothetical protein
MSDLFLPELFGINELGTRNTWNAWSYVSHYLECTVFV